MSIEVIYVRGNDPHAPEIAAKAGAKYGTRHDCKPYGDVWMLDIKWDDYDWQRYLLLIREYRPSVALAPDYERPEQRETLMSQIADLRPLVNRVLVCPKFHGAVAHIPMDCVIALSVPAPTYAGFLPDLRTLAGRKVHLLGGSLKKQVELITKLNALDADVISVDGNTIGRKAGLGQVFREGAWIQSRSRSAPDWQLAELSAQNYVKYIQSAVGVKQLPFWDASTLRAESTIRHATADDIPAIKKIAQQHPQALGFVNRAALLESIERRNLMVAVSDTQVVGFVNYRACRDGWSTVYEIAVDKARQGQHIGAGLIAAVPQPIRLKCPVDNASNGFYAAQGFTHVDIVDGRKRRLNVWHKGKA